MSEYPPPPVPADAPVAGPQGVSDPPATSPAGPSEPPPADPAGRSDSPTVPVDAVSYPRLIAPTEPSDLPVTVEAAGADLPGDAGSEVDEILGDFRRWY